MHGECGATDALYTDAERLQESTDFLNLVVGRCVFDNGCSRDTRCGKERVLSRGVAGFFKDDGRGRESFMRNMEAIGERIYRNTEALQCPEVGAHGACAEVTAS